TPSWGNMLSEEARRYFERAPWMALPPGIALSLTVMSINFLGDALRDALDPRLRRSQG
ncbi:MAG: ABC transporter permease, partial [bacterium]